MIKRCTSRFTDANIFPAFHLFSLTYSLQPVLPHVHLCRGLDEQQSILVSVVLREYRTWILLPFIGVIGRRSQLSEFFNLPEWWIISRLSKFWSFGVKQNRPELFFGDFQRNNVPADPRSTTVPLIHQRLFQRLDFLRSKEGQMWSLKRRLCPGLWRVREY